MLFAISILLIIVLYSSIKLVTSSSISRKKYYRNTWLFIVGMGLLAFYFNPTSTGIIEDEYSTAQWDLSRYYIEIIDASKYSFQQLLTSHLSITEPLRFICWKVLSWIPTVKSLQVISVVVACGLVLYCTLKSRDICYAERMIAGRRDYRFEYSVITITYISLFAMIDYFEMMNTGRYIIACICSIPGIIKVYQKNTKLIGYILIGIAGMLHVAMWGVFLIVILNDVFIRFERAKIVLIGWRFFAILVVGALKALPFIQFSSLAGKIVTEATFKQMTTNRILYVIMFVVFSICAYYFIYKKKKSIKSRHYGSCYIKILNLMQIFLLLMIGGLETNISYRLGYLIAFMAPFYLLDNKTVKTRLRGTNLPTILYIISALGLIVYEFEKSMVLMNASGAYFG